MIILDKPYVSNFLLKSIKELKLPILNNTTLKELNLNSNEYCILDNEEFINKFKVNEDQLLYSNSENPIKWITDHLFFSDLPNQIKLFKDKVKFRDLIQKRYPNFFYKEISLQEIDDIDISKIKMPFIIKPSVGFFSIGVYKVTNIKDWEFAVRNIKEESTKANDRYPTEVINSNTFIIEDFIDGEEFAIDVYFNREGEAVILNILKHIFSSDEDVSDRVYVTSKEIIGKHLQPFTLFLSELGNISKLKNIPLHVELRLDLENKIMPIEVNPMRFAGWCTTDIAYYAYGINVYEYYFKQKKPCWDEILKGKERKLFSIVVADLPKDLPLDKIKGINYKSFRSHFEKTLELREINFKKHGVFAFLFAETYEEHWSEIEYILKSSLKEYIKLEG